MSTHNICFPREISKTSCRYPLLSVAMTISKDQPAHLRSLIRVSADGMCLLQPLGYPKRDK